jgi:hypothetical protein
MIETALPVVDPDSARIDGIVARGGDIAVIFRRGPSRRTRLIVWNLQSDTLELGQWFKGRIYARRSDLTPAGDKLVYFAASFRAPYYSWTAISRPPWLTALALWPKGDCWGGGGLFESPRHLKLNHRTKPKSSAPEQDELRLAPGGRLPKGFRVEALHEHSGWGEDDPIFSMRLARDGWCFDQNAPASSESKSNRFWCRFDPPIMRRRPLARTRTKTTEPCLRVSLHAISERQGRWYIETADLVDAEDRVLRDLGRVDWADADGAGGVLFGKDGCLFRIRSPSLTAKPKLVANLNEMAFEAIASPIAARRW